MLQNSYFSVNQPVKQPYIVGLIMKHKCCNKIKYLQTCKASKLENKVGRQDTAAISTSANFLYNTKYLRTVALVSKSIVIFVLCHHFTSVLICHTTHTKKVRPAPSTHSLYTECQSNHCTQSGRWFYLVSWLLLSRIVSYINKRDTRRKGWRCQIVVIVTNSGPNVLNLYFMFKFAELKLEIWDSQCTANILMLIILWFTVYSIQGMGHSTQVEMECNAKQWEVLQYTRKFNKIYFEYNVNGEIFSVTESVKYIGLTINNRPTWPDHILSR